MNTEQAAFLYVGAFVDELARAGLRHVVACPGSRSTPLAFRLAEEPRIKLWLLLDERSAAFFALGMAKALRFPVGLLCTSGTAAANFLPAIVESQAAHVPLVVLTADRPPELRDTGAPQTIDQLKLYGNFVKWFVEMALPEGTPDALRYARTIACRAAAAAMAQPAGAVHLNFPFREPLVPAAVEVSAPSEDAQAFFGRPDNRPYLRGDALVRSVEPNSAAQLAADLLQMERGLIVAGPGNEAGLAAEVAGLGGALGYPILADPLSGVRCGRHDRANIVDAYDAFLRDADLVNLLEPEVVLSLGAIPTSKPVLQYLRQHARCRQILVGPDLSDPNRLAADSFQVDPVNFCQAIRANIVDEARPPAGAGSASHWLKLWREVQIRARAAIVAAVDARPELFEGRVFSELASCLPEGATVWVSSSMPVRDLDSFFPGSDRDVQFLSNRGANGIDGVVSSALGAAAVSGRPLVLVIGDIAFYHDMNGLLASKLYQLNATVVLLNNDGGGIFSFLPQAAHSEHFEELFGTPHGLDFKPAAELYGATYLNPVSWSEFRRAIQVSVLGPGLSIVEVRTDRRRNVELHRAIWPRVSAALQNLPGA